MIFPRCQYGVIYADPPWQYKMYSEKGYEKAPEAHYKTMSDDEIIAMRDDVLFAAAPNSVLFMWGIWPKLPSLTKVVEAWGFTHCTGGSWSKVTTHGKQGFGTGFVMRSASEPFVIATIGKPKIKNKRTRNHLYTGEFPDDLGDLDISVNCRLRDHSQKPDEIYPLIEDLFDGAYLELFARQQRPGWDFWGNETTKYGDAA